MKSGGKREWMPMSSGVKTLDQVKSVEHVDDNNLYITSTIIDACNYSCQYCFNIDDRKSQKLDLDQFFKLLRKVRTENTARKLNIVLIGGEPTLHDQLEDFCCKVDQELEFSEVNICTNFSKSVEWYASMMQRTSSINFILSWHSTREDPLNKDFLAKLQKLKDLIEDRSRFEVLVMAETNNFSNSLLALKMVKALFRDWKTRGPIIEFNLLKQTCSYQHAYTSHDLEVFSKHKIMNNDFHIVSLDGDIQKLRINDVVESDSFSFTGWRCDAGKTNIYVHVDGSVHPCYGYYLAHKKPIARVQDDLESQQILSTSLMKCSAPVCGLDCCYTSKYKTTQDRD